MTDFGRFLFDLAAGAAIRDQQYDFLKETPKRDRSNEHVKERPRRRGVSPQSPA